MPKPANVVKFSEREERRVVSQSGFLSPGWQGSEDGSKQLKPDYIGTIMEPRTVSRSGTMSPGSWESEAGRKQLKSPLSRPISNEYGQVCCRTMLAILKEPKL